MPLRVIQPQHSRGSLQRLKENSRSTAATLGERIHEDIHNGNYDCSVCYSNVRRASTVWSCRKCWNVFHHDCIRQWAASRGVYVSCDSRRWNDVAWSCPSCRASYAGPPLTSCWCGRNHHPQYSADHGRGILVHNSCGAKCHHVTPCGQPCERICHAGPCTPCEVRDTLSSQPNLPNPASGLSMPAATHDAQSRQQRSSAAPDHELQRSTIPLSAPPNLWPIGNPLSRDGGPQDYYDRAVQSAPLLLTRSLLFLSGHAVVGCLVNYLRMVVIEPYHHRFIAVNHALMAVLYTVVMCVALAQCYNNWLFWKVVMFFVSWCRRASNISNWGRHQGSRFSVLKQTCSTIIRRVMLCFGVCFFSALALAPFARYVSNELSAISSLS